MLERRHERLLPARAFARRMAVYAAFSLGLIGVSLVAGIAGYRGFEGMAWVDAFVNASMIMGGMGPMGELHTSAGKVFAGVYALYCGVVLLVSVGLLMAPLFHRFLHRFHLEIGDRSA